MIPLSPIGLWASLPAPAARLLHAGLARAALALKPKLRAKTERALAGAAPFLEAVPEPREALAALAENVRLSARLLADPGFAGRTRVDGLEELARAASQSPFAVVCGVHQGLWELLPRSLAARGYDVRVPAARLRHFDRAVSRLRSPDGAAGLPVRYFPGEELPREIRALARASRAASSSRPSPETSPALSASPNGTRDDSSSRPSPETTPTLAANPNDSRDTSSSRPVLAFPILALLIDQPGPNCRDQVRLFGQPRVWWSAPLELCSRLGAPVLPFSARMTPSGPEIRLFPPLEGDVAAESAAWAQREIAARPAEWVWHY